MSVRLLSEEELSKMIAGPSGAGGRACNIHSIFKVRLMFGLYHEPGSHQAPATRAALKLYCVAFGICFLYYFYTTVYGLGNIFVFSMAAEYIFYFCMSMFTEDKYLLDFYRYIPAVDGLPHAKRLYQKLELFLNLSMATHFVNRFLTTVLYCFFFGDDVIAMVKSASLWTDQLTWLTVDVTHHTMLLILALLYCRVRLFCNTLLSNGFANTPLDRFPPKRYMQIYETIMESLDEEKLMYLVHITLGLCLPRVLLELHASIGDMKTNGLQLKPAVMLTLLLSQQFLSIIAAAIMCDLTNDCIDDAIAFAVEKRVECTDERARDEIQHLITALQLRGLASRVWRLLPLSVRNLTVLFSFCLTTVIALLQINF